MNQMTLTFRNSIKNSRSEERIRTLDLLPLSLPHSERTENKKPFQRGDRLYTSESDYKDGPRDQRVELFIMAVDT